MPAPCRDFAAGRCRRGDTCKFSHGTPDAVAGAAPIDAAPATSSSAGVMTPPATPNGATAKSGKPRICRLYKLGRCSRGNRCRFIHVGPVFGARSTAKPATISELARTKIGILQKIGSMLDSRSLVALAQAAKPLWNALGGLFEARCWADWQAGVPSVSVAFLPYAPWVKEAGKAVGKQPKAGDRAEINQNNVFARLRKIDRKAVADGGLKFVAVPDPKKVVDQAFAFFDELEESSASDESDSSEDYSDDSEDFEYYAMPYTSKELHAYRKQLALQNKINNACSGTRWKCISLSIPQKRNLPKIVLYVYLDHPQDNSTISSNLKSKGDLLPDEVLALQLNSMPETEVIEVTTTESGIKCGLFFDRLPDGDEERVQISLRDLQVTAAIARRWWISFWSFRLEVEELMREEAKLESKMKRDELDKMLKDKVCHMCAMRGHTVRDCPCQMLE